MNALDRRMIQASRSTGIVHGGGATNLVAALAVAKEGIPVFPCRPDGKEPLTTRGLHAATTDAAVIRRWWHRWPSANLAARTGITFDVLDIDTKNGAPGMASLAKLRAAGLLGGVWRMVETPSGGLHVFLKPNGDGNHTVARFGVDYRGVGGYVVVPPSAINGRAYQVLDERPIAQAGTISWPAVKRTLGIVDPPSRPVPTDAPGDIAALVRYVSTLREGNRNAGLHWAACRAWECGADPAPLIIAALATGLDRLEAERTIASAARTVGVARDGTRSAAMICPVVPL